jgi:hypothetical protein
LRRLWIHHVLPAVFAAIPILAAALLLVAVPADARGHYLDRVRTSPIDWIIIALGFALFAVQVVLSWRALKWQETDFDLRTDRWLSHLGQGAEWFPLLGLIGTVVAILQTFTSIKPGVTPQDIIHAYGPAITATGGGLYMAFINILPVWVVAVGRDLIRSLAGFAPAPPPSPIATPPLSPGDKP